MSASQEGLSDYKFSEEGIERLDKNRAKELENMISFEQFALQNQQFFDQNSKNIIKMKNMLNRLQISEKTGLPLNFVSHILKQNQSNSSEEDIMKQEENDFKYEENAPQSKKSNATEAESKQSSSEAQLQQDVKIESLEKPESSFGTNETENQTELEKSKIDQKLEELEKKIKEFQNPSKMDQLQNTEENYKATKASNLEEENNDLNIQQSKQKKALKAQQKNEEPEVYLRGQEIIRMTNNGFVVKSQKKKGQYICFYCFKSYSEAELLQKHFAQGHQSEKPLTLFCPLCKDLTFDKSSTYQCHLKIHEKKGEIINYTFEQIQQSQQQINDIQLSKNQAQKNSLQSIEIDQWSTLVNYFQILKGKQQDLKITLQKKQENLAQKDSGKILILELENINKSKEENEFIADQNQINNSNNQSSNQDLQAIEKENTTIQYGNIIFDKNNNALYECKECKEFFKKCQSLSKHFKKQHPKAQLNKLKCLECDLPFIKRKYLLKHLVCHKAKDYQNQKTSQNPEIFIFQQCNRKEHSTQKILTQHYQLQHIDVYDRLHKKKKTENANKIQQQNNPIQQPDQDANQEEEKNIQKSSQQEEKENEDNNQDENFMQKDQEDLSKEEKDQRENLEAKVEIKNFVPFKEVKQTHKTTSKQKKKKSTSEDKFQGFQSYRRVPVLDLANQFKSISNENQFTNPIQQAYPSEQMMTAQSNQF